jgi:hypothetical protein
VQLAAAPSIASTEAVERPEPGLARGRWEAPAWVFYAALAAAAAFGLAWLAVAIRARRPAR